MLAKPHTLSLKYSSFIGLFALVVAQPVLDLLGTNIEFFAFRQSGMLEILIFAMVLALAIPTFFYVCSRIITTLFPAAKLLISLAWIGVFGALFVLGIFQFTDITGDWAKIAIAVSISVLSIVSFYKSSHVRAFVDYIALIALVLPAVFLWAAFSNLKDSGSGQLGDITTHSKNTPVFMLVFDELPLGGLLDSTGGIDAQRYPSFSKFVSTSTWYKNASTVTDSTSLAIPAILTGKRPTPSPEGAMVASTAVNHPRTLFSLLNGSHTIKATETITRLCPSQICIKQEEKHSLSLYEKTHTAIIDSAVLYAHMIVPERFAAHLPPINSNWGGFKADRFGVNIQGLFYNPKKVAGVFDRVAKASAQDVYYLHLNMPHHPWIHYASGKRYFKGYFGNDLHPQVIDWLHSDGYKWGTNSDALEVARQRQQLQIAYSDKLLGRFLSSIESSGLFDQALIFIVADHGSNIAPNQIFRWATQDNAEHLMSIPLMVKYPKQKRPVVNNLNAETIDIMPTIAQVLQVEHNWNFDGHSLLDLENKPSKDKSIMRSIPPRSSDEFKQMPRVLRFKGFDIFNAISKDALTHFREHDGSLHGDTYLHDRSYAPALLGLKTLEAPTTNSTRVANIVTSGDFSNVKLHRLVFPGFLRVDIPKQSADEEILLAFVVNGTVHATRFIDASNSGTLEAILPEAAFTNGNNQLEVFIVNNASLRGAITETLNVSELKLEKLTLNVSVQP